MSRESLWCKAFGGNPGVWVYGEGPIWRPIANCTAAGLDAIGA